VAQTSYPFDGQATSESQFSQFFKQLQDTGVAGSATATDLKVGADSSDVIVLRLDPAANSIELAIVQGTPGSGTPGLVQTDTDTYELALGYVAVGANITSISPAAVTDARTFTGTRNGAWSNDSRPTNPRAGRLGLNLSTGQWEFWTGSAWSNLAPTVAWSAVADKPAAFPPSAHGHDWADVTGKPSAFPPSSHSHDWSQITGELPFASTSHTHSSYLTAGDTIKYANGSKRPYVNAASGSNWYAVWVENGGDFCRNTSAAKFKTNIRDFDITPDTVLAMRPVIYDRKDTVDEETGQTKEGRKDEVGLIADEVHELGLEWMVNYLDGEVDGLRYDLLGVALLPVVQRQQVHIDDLGARLARLEAAQ
jgi:Chaperone of endosialidase